MENERRDNILTRVFILAFIILILTFSIGLPIYFRPFYYMQIDALGLPERTGYTKAEIKDAYNELLNYLTLPGAKFGTGVFPYSLEGESHFQDCKYLFNLNLILGLISLTIVITLWLLDKKRKIALSRPNKHHISYSVCKTMLIIVVIFSILASINFTWTFEVFHKTMFRGKTNWGFMETLDPIILALPEKFFANCAVLILSSIITICVIFIICEKVKENRRD